jgi:hypothetical protein
MMVSKMPMRKGVTADGEDGVRKPCAVATRLPIIKYRTFIVNVRIQWAILN